MSDEREAGRGPAAVAECRRPVGSTVRLLIALSVAWAVGWEVVPYARENVPLFMTGPAVVVVLCAGLAWWVFRQWWTAKRPSTVAGGVKFFLPAAFVAAGLWFVMESSVLFEVFGFSAAAVLAAGIVLVLIWYEAHFVARFYWDTKVRLAALEEIVRLQGYDPEQLRGELFARPDWKSDPSLRSRVVRSVAGRDLGT